MLPDGDVYVFFVNVGEICIRIDTSGVIPPRPKKI